MIEDTKQSKDIKAQQQLVPKKQLQNNQNQVKKLNQVVIINNSTYNIQIITNHQSGLKVKTLISTDYVKWVQQFVRQKSTPISSSKTPDPIKDLVLHRMYYPQTPILKMGPKDAINNQGKAYQIICTKPMINWDDVPQFAAVQVPRPQKSTK